MGARLDGMSRRNTRSSLPLTNPISSISVCLNVDYFASLPQSTTRTLTWRFKISAKIDVWNTQVNEPFGSGGVRYLPSTRANVQLLWEVLESIDMNIDRDSHILPYKCSSSLPCCETERRIVCRWSGHR